MKQQRKLSKHLRFTYQNRENIYGYIFLAPSLIGVLIFVLLPFIDAIRRSFLSAMGKTFVGFDNYITVIHNEAFRLAAGNTVRFIAICIPILLILSLSLALIIYDKKKYQEFYKSVLLLPMAIPVASIVVLWKAFFHIDGIVNNILNIFKMQSIDFINSSSAFHVLIFTYIWKNIGYVMILWIGGLSSISLSIYEAAKVDGAGAIRCFWYITLPGLKSTFFIIFILSLVNSFKVFREAYLISGAYPNESIYMLQHLFNNWFVDLDIQKMCAGATMMAVVFIVIVIFMHSFKKEEM
jgi:multiple sugar transport system permease protein